MNPLEHGVNGHKPLASSLGLMMCFMLQSLSSIVAVPSAADTWTNLTNIRVPAQAQRISRITVSVAADPGTSATSIRQAPVFDLIGSGLGEQNPHSLLGAFGGWSMVTDGAYSLQNSQMVYEVDLPVSVGADITPRVNTLDEAITAGTCTVVLEFDTVTPRSASNSMSDYVDVAGTTNADAWTAVGTLTVPVAPSGRQPSKITAVTIGVAVDMGTSAISLRVQPRIQLLGAGIKGDSAAIELLGPTATSNQVTAGSSGFANLTKFIDLRRNPIYVNPAGQITVNHRYDVEVPTASTVAVGVMYA